MTRTQRAACCTGFAAIAIAAFALRAPAQDALDSLTVCHDTQKLIFENAFVRVIDDVIPPGVSEPKHHHPRGLVITLVDADVETTSGTGNPARAHGAAGSVRWNEPLTHTVHNVGAAATHYIRIDVK